MRPRITPTIAAMLVLVLCRTAVDQGLARVIIDGKASNPAVEEGGHRLSRQPPPPIPYSLIGAIAAEGSWIGTCATWPRMWPWRWPWRLPGWFSFNHHRAFGRVPARPPDRDPIEWVPPPLP